MRERGLRLPFPVSTPLAGLAARKGFEKQSTEFITRNNLSVQLEKCQSSKSFDTRSRYN